MQDIKIKPCTNPKLEEQIQGILRLIEETYR